MQFAVKVFAVHSYNLCMGQRRRKVLGLSWPDLAILTGYIAVLCLAIPHYLPWEDEGRAWIGARTLGLFDLIFHFLRYEGHPAVWYLVLWPLAHLHMPYLYINWLSAACGISGIYFLLRYSPFPLYIRATLPFGFALAYQYAVVARSYCLFPLFGFMVAHEYRQPTRRPIRMAILLALLANLTVHGTIIATVFGASYAWDLIRERGVAPEPPWTVRQARLGGSIFAASIVFVLVVLWPAHDLQPPVSPGVGHFLHRISPSAYHPIASAPHLLRASATISQQTPQAPPRLALNLGIGSMKLGGRLRTTFIYPIATFAPLAILFQILVFALVWRRGKPLLILAPLLVGGFIVQIYLRLWHTSLIWIALVMLLWVVWDEQEKFPRLSLQNAVAAVFALICVLQIPWTVAALRFERTHATYPAKATADYLKSLPQNTRIDGFDHSISLLPYFAQYPFHLQTDVLDVPTALADHPDAILLRQATPTPEQLAELSAAGYQLTHTFCGTPFYPNQPLVPMCLDVLEKH